MKNILVTLAFAATLAGCAAPHAPQDFDFSGLSTGMIESVRQVPLDIHAFQEAIEHKINPDVGHQLLIRLDDGRAVTMLEGMRRFEPGERVRIVAGRVEREAAVSDVTPRGVF